MAELVMTRPNGLDVPEAVVVLIAALPFEVKVWPAAATGRSDEFPLTKGPDEWGARAGGPWRDDLCGTTYNVPTLRAAVLDALHERAKRCDAAAEASDAEAKRVRLPYRKESARKHAQEHRAQAALIRETVAAMMATWPASGVEVSSP